MINLQLPVLSKRLVVFGGGAVTVALVVVLGLVVWRVQNAKPTVTRPKAEGDMSICGHQGGLPIRRLVSLHWCKFQNDTPASQQCGDNPVSGLNVKIISYAGVVLNGENGSNSQDGQIDNLCEDQQHTVQVSGMSSPAVFYCTNDQKVSYSNGKASCGGSSATRVDGSSATFDLPDGENGKAIVYVAFVSGASGGGGGGWGGYTAVSPIGGATVGSLKPTFNWSGTMPANNNYENICIGTWINSVGCDSLGCRGVTGQNSYTMPEGLSPNSTYGWTVYSAYTPGTTNVTNMNGGCQQFKTPDIQTCPSGQTLCGSTCVNLQTDNNNCGVCGKACTSGQTCSNGRCTISCSGPTPDLCGTTCTNKQTDVNNCGTCGDVCNATNGTATCSSGACGITCSSGYGNCDNNGNNGCETALNTTGNCGSCGKVCNTTNGTAACTNLACTTTCSSGYGNCDGDVSNGCETPLNTTANCGTCGNACTTGQVCSSGVCTTTCSGSTPDLCGTTCTNKQTDSNNCGTCGNICSSGQSCVNGQCTSVSNEVNSCWGNGGVNGACYDCNGDGAINILDFSCFAKVYSKNVQ